jgi:hypothetical protein
LTRSEQNACEEADTRNRQVRYGTFSSEIPKLIGNRTGNREALMSTKNEWHGTPYRSPGRVLFRWETLIVGVRGRKYNKAILQTCFKCGELVFEVWGVKVSSVGS